VTGCISGRDALLNEGGQPDLIVLRRTDKLDPYPGPLDPANSGERDIHRTGLIWEKQAKLYVISLVQTMDTLDEAARQRHI
jgi:hypothetical protein